MDDEQTGARARKKRLYSKRAAEGLGQVSGWVPIERRSYARAVLKAVADGANSLPPDPETVAELAAARATIERIEADAAASQAEANATIARIEGEAQAAHAEAQAAIQRAEKAEAAMRRAKTLPGVRGRLVRWLAGDVLPD
jgi:chromosome segregation ATPase